MADPIFTDVGIYAAVVKACQRYAPGLGSGTVQAIANASARLGNREGNDEQPIPMLLVCPECRQRHIDVGDFATKAHHTHACQVCGHVWRPAKVATVGVAFLPGFKNET